MTKKEQNTSTHLLSIVSVQPVQLENANAGAKPKLTQKHKCDANRSFVGVLGAELLVARTALRAFRNGLTATVKQCCGSWELLARCFDPYFVECVNFRALNIIESLTRDNIRTFEEELFGLDIKPSGEGHDPCLMCFEPAKIGFQQEETYHPCHLERRRRAEQEPDEAARTLCQHWSGIFSARSADMPSDCAETVLTFIQPAPPELRWSIGSDEFEELLDSNRESAPDQMVYLEVCIALLAALFFFVERVVKSLSPLS